MNEELKKILSEVAKEFQITDENMGKVIDKLSKIFESAVEAKVATILEDRENDYKGELLQEATETKETLIDTLDQYLNEAVENYALDFGDVIVNATKATIYESLTNSIKESFASQGLKLEEGSEEIVSKLSAETETLRDQLNETVNENMGLRSEVLAEKVKSVFLQETMDLTEMDRERLKDLLAESEFDTTETAREKIVLMKEHFLDKDEDDKHETLTEDTIFGKKVNTSDRARKMAEYLNK